MKYYAVTEDPNELYHYGVKGMKWGQHIFGEKPRSPGYKKAASKLRASLKNGIKNTQAHWAQSKELRSIRKERQAENLANRRLNEALGAQAMKQARKEQRAVRAEMRKEASAERREQRHMQRYLEKARKGTLKYKKLRDDQVGAIAERLNLENQARRLSGNETPHMLTRIKRSIGEGVVRGVGSAVAVGIEESARAKVRYKNEKKYGAKTSRAKIKADMKNAKLQAKADADKEFYEMQTENGDWRTASQVFGPHARARRQKALSEHKRVEKLKAADKEYEKLARTEQIKAYTRRLPSETPENYAKRMQENNWATAIGYQTYSPSPSAKVVKRQQKQQRREYNKQAKSIEKMQKQEEAKALAAENERQRRADEAERQRYRANIAKAVNEVGRKEAERNIQERYRLGDVGMAQKAVTQRYHDKNIAGITSEQLAAARRAQRAAEAERKHQLEAIEARQKEFSTNLGNPTYYHGNGGHAYPRSRTKRKSTVRRVHGFFSNS